MIDGATAANNTPSATVNSEWYLEYSRDIRKTKTLINHVLIASHANQYRSGTQKWEHYNCMGGIHPFLRQDMTLQPFLRGRWIYSLRFDIIFVAI